MAQKNILLFMTDQQRPDYVGYIPYGKVDTPNMDWIAEGSAFGACQTVNPICTPARTALITGRYPRQIGTLTMSGDLFHQIPTFMQALQKEGYTTYGIGKFHYLQTWPWGIPRGTGSHFIKNEEDTKRFGYDHIWETAGKQQLNINYCYYCDYLNQKGLLEKVRDFCVTSGGKNGDTADHNYDKATPWPFDEEDYIDVVTGRKAQEYLNNHPEDKPFYMMVSFCGPHKTYDAPQRYIDMFELETDDDFILQEGQSLSEEEKTILYKQRQSARAMVKLIDDQIGEILELLRRKGKLDDTLIILTSDHGDMLGDHYMIQKGVPWKQASTVPLAIRLPGYKKSGIIDSPVELTDIAATILDYAGLDPEIALSRPWPAYNDLIPCRSLLPVVKGEADSIRDYTFTETDFTEERHQDSNIEETIKKRGDGRSNAWQMIQTAGYKYIKYLGYTEPGNYHEELYDLGKDPDELHNAAADPRYAEVVRLSRDRLMYIMDHYPPAQKVWAKVNAADL
ncbi:MAG TPA: sulfatase-like hydrolase/transferase [Clostridia bacterium]|nr:sulfatase-like hydrolase/transferase [Clostridia bacterium]